MFPGEDQRGVIYTVDPRILAPLTPGEEYRVVASTRFLIAEDAAFTKFGSKFWYDEFYNDFDMRTDRRQPSVLIVSYGEYVPSQDDVDFDSVIARAENRARSYVDVVKDEGEDLRIARREWNCLDTGKAGKPFLAHVDLSFQRTKD